MFINTEKIVSIVKEQTSKSIDNIKIIPVE